MKKSIILLFFALTFASFGQTNYFFIGLESGPSLASLRGNSFIDKYHNSRTGYSGGLFFQYNLQKIISIKTGCYYELKGSSTELLLTDQNGQPIGPVHGKENFEYLTVPFLAKATFGNNVNYFVNAGPYIGFLIKQTEKTEAFQNYPSTNSDNSENFNNVEIGLSAGLGLSYTMQQKYSFSTEVRNNLGLTNTSELQISNNGTIKTNSLYVLFSFVYIL